MQVVVIRMLLDDNCDGKVTRSELQHLHLSAIEFAKTQALEAPETFSDLLQAIFLGFNRTGLEPTMRNTTSSSMTLITATLKVCP